MKTTLTVLALIFASNFAMASNEIQPYEAAVGAESLVRQVVKKRLLPNDSKHLSADLLHALTGSTKPSTMTEITCERSLGIDECSIQFVVGRNSKDGAYSFKLQVRLYQGRILSARITDFIG